MTCNTVFKMQNKKIFSQGVCNYQDIVIVIQYIMSLVELIRIKRESKKVCHTLLQEHYTKAKIAANRREVI